MEREEAYRPEPSEFTIREFAWLVGLLSAFVTSLVYWMTQNLVLLLVFAFFGGMLVQMWLSFHPSQLTSGFIDFTWSVTAIGASFGPPLAFCLSYVARRPMFVTPEVPPETILAFALVFCALRCLLEGVYYWRRVRRFIQDLTRGWETPVRYFFGD